MSKYSLWVHGQVAQPQNEGYNVSKIYMGWGAVFKTTGRQWFHFAIPTPVIVGSIDTIIQKVFVLFNTSGTTKIISVHVWDGPNKIQTFDNLSLSGDHSGALDNNNTWNVNQVHIKWGLDVSVLVDFGPASHSGVPEITFTSAGADFLTP